MSADSDTVAVITDIHGNLPALQAALARIEELGIECVFCGGDLVGYGPHPNEVCALIAQREIPTIYGNVRTLYPDVTPAEAAEVMLPHSDDGHQDPDAAFRTAAKIDERTAP